MTYNEAIAKKEKYYNYLAKTINVHGVESDIDFIVVCKKRSGNLIDTMIIGSASMEKAISDDFEYNEQLKSENCEILFILDWEKRKQVFLEIGESNSLPGFFMDEGAFLHAVDINSQNSK